MAKKLPPELLLRDPALRRSCQLVLQPPGSLMFVAPVSFGVGRGGWSFRDQTDDTPACTGAAGTARPGPAPAPPPAGTATPDLCHPPLAAPQGPLYHAVHVSGFCWAEASNHWHALGSASERTPADWLERWGEMEAPSPTAWHERMQPLWGFFRRLKGFAEVAAPVRKLLGRQPR